MIPTPFLAEIPPFPIDQTEIRTCVRIKDVIGDCLPDKLHELPSYIRELIRSMSAGAQSETPNRSLPDQPTPRYDPRIPTRVIKLEGFDVVTLHAKECPVRGWQIKKIRFNPGNLYNGHNGQILSELEFQMALTILIQVLTPLLHDPEDWIHIVPGLDDKSRAWWQSIEIPFHVLDEEGVILKAFSKAKHRDIHLDPLYYRSAESTAFKSSNENLMIRIYRKDIQMAKKHGRFILDLPQAVLRIEVRLKGNKLRKYLRDGVWDAPEEISKLVSFNADALRVAHGRVMSEFKGCFTRTPAGDVETSNDRIGRMMGWVASECGLAVDDQWSYFVRRFLSGNTVESNRNAKSRLLRAARDELSLLSPIKLEELFSESAWQNQSVIEIAELETMTRARYDGLNINPLVAKVYGSDSTRSSGVR